MNITREQYDADMREAGQRALLNLARHAQSIGLIGPDEIRDIAAEGNLL